MGSVTHILSIWQVDCLQLADCFESYRKLGMETYMLDPSCFISAPSFSWEAMLLSTQVQLELITDPEIYRFMEAGVRGGVSSGEILM